MREPPVCLNLSIPAVPSKDTPVRETCVEGSGLAPENPGLSFPGLYLNG